MVRTLLHTVHRTEAETTHSFVGRVGKLRAPLRKDMGSRIICEVKTEDSKSGLRKRWVSAHNATPMDGASATDTYRTSLY